MMMIFVTYDSTQAYPQAAVFGLGVIHVDGTHTPPIGLSSFSVDDSTLVHGIEDDYYEVTAADILTAKSQVIVDADVLDKYKTTIKDRVQVDAELYLEKTYPLREQLHISMGAISQAKYDELKVDIIALRNIVITAYGDINAAIDITAVDTVYSGITFPVLPTT